MALLKKTLSGIVWTFSNSMILNGLSVITTFYLAKLLGPEVFGLLGMIAIFVALGIALVDGGMSQSIIRNKYSNHKDYSTVFYLNLAMSIFLYIVIYFLAVYIADYFKQPILINVLRLYCLIFVINAFSSVQLAILNKEMQFKKITILGIPSSLISILVGLALAWKGWGIYSIIWMYLSKQIIFTIQLWITSQWRPSLYFSKAKVKYHFKFGYKLTLSSMLDTVYQNIYNVLIGRFYPIAMLGFYERAKSLNMYPMTVVSTVIGKVTYPLMSEIKNDPHRLSKVYKQILQTVYFISSPLMLLAAALANPLFKIILGDEWMEAVPFFQILCLSSMLYPVHAFNLNIMKVKGRSDLFLKAEIIKKIVATIVIIIMSFFGIWGLIWSSVITSYLSLIVNIYYSKDLINYSLKEQVVDIFATLLKSGSIAISVYFVIDSLQYLSAFLQIAIGFGLGIMLYFGINILLKSNQIEFLKTIYKLKIQKK